MQNELIFIGADYGFMQHTKALARICLRLAAEQGIRACLSEDTAADAQDLRIRVLADGADAAPETEARSHIVWVLNYAKTEAAQEKINATDGSCIMVDVSPQFPFLSVLRKRAEIHLGDRSLIELPPFRQRQFVGDGQTDISPLIAQPLSVMLNHAVSRVSEPLEPAEIQTEEEIGQEEGIEAEERMEPAAGMELVEEIESAEDVEPAEGMVYPLPVDLLTVAKFMGFPLLDIYEKIKHRITDKKNIPPLVDDNLRETYQAVRQYRRDADQEVQRLLAWVGIFMLCDKYRKQGLDASPLHRDIIHFAPANHDEYLPILYLNQLLLGEQVGFSRDIMVSEPNDFLNRFNKGLKSSVSSANHKLLFAVVLRAALSVYKRGEERKTIGKKLRTALETLNKDEIAAIGGEAIIAFAEQAENGLGSRPASELPASSSDDIADSPPAEDEANRSSPIDLMKVTELLGLPLPAAYQKVAQQVADKENVVTPFVDDNLQEVYQAIRRRGREAERLPAWIGILILCDAYRKQGLDPRPLHKDIVDFAPPNPEEYALLSHLNQLLSDEREGFLPGVTSPDFNDYLTQFDEELAGDKSVTDHKLFSAVVLRVALVVYKRGGEQKAIREKLRDILKALDDNENAAVGGAAFLAVDGVKQDIRDVL